MITLFVSLLLSSVQAASIVDTASVKMKIKGTFQGASDGSALTVCLMSRTQLIATTVQSTTVNADFVMDGNFMPSSYLADVPTETVVRTEVKEFCQLAVLKGNQFSLDFDQWETLWSNNLFTKTRTSIQSFYVTVTAENLTWKSAHVGAEELKNVGGFNTEELTGSIQLGLQDGVLTVQ